MTPMPPSTPRCLRRWLALALGCAGALAAVGRADPSPDTPLKRLNRFSLAPRSAQADPLLDITVMTDVTDAGKKLPKVTKDHPVFYLAHSEGFKELGEGVPTGETLGEEDMGRFLRTSLADAGYREAGPATPAPSQVILYSWGLYSKQIDYGQGITALDTKEMFERASIIGGDEFARKLLKMLQWKSVAGASTTGKRNKTSNIADPMYTYQLEGGRNHELMLEMADNDIYYVIASAYDYAAFRQHQPVLLWRTRMAILAEGVTQPQVLPTMVLGASPYFGKQTRGDPTILTRHAVGQVEVGPVQVVSFGTPTEAPAAPIAPAAPPAPSEAPVPGK
jgi:hypothetical protein